MRTLLVFALLGQLVTFVPDAIQKDTVRVEKHGVKQYELKKDVLLPDTCNVYDKNGEQVGTWKKDVLFPERYRFEENR